MSRRIRYNNWIDQLYNDKKLDLKFKIAYDILSINSYKNIDKFTLSNMTNININQIELMIKQKFYRTKILRKMKKFLDRQNIYN